MYYKKTEQSFPTLLLYEVCHLFSSLKSPGLFSYSIVEAFIFQ